MKYATITLLLATLGAVSSMGQPIISSGTVSLTSTGTTTVYSVLGNGTLLGVGCTVTTAPDANSSVLKVSVANGANLTSYTMYSSSQTWVTSLLPFSNGWVGQSGGPGLYPNDSFYLPLNEAYATGLLVEVDVTSAASSQGALSCSVLHT
jgi:hypothetical protein